MKIEISLVKYVLLGKKFKSIFKLFLLMMIDIYYLYMNSMTNK